MKKLLLCLLLPSSLCAYGWPPAFTIPFMVPLLIGKQNINEAMLDGLQFEHARGIHYRFEVAGTQVADSNENDLDDAQYESHPLVIDYHLRWGYKGAGAKHQPFTGMQARFNIELSYEGVSFHLCKSKTLRKKLLTTLKPLLHVSPCQEFYLKMLQLAWTISQHNEVDHAMVQCNLETLFSRLKVTQDGHHCRLYGMPVLNSIKSPGLELFLHQAPTLFTQRFVMMSQKLGSVFGLLAAPQSRNEQEAYMRGLLAQIDYYQDGPYKIMMPRGGTITLPFASSGSGSPYQPFTGTTLTFDIPAKRGVALAETPQDTTPSRWSIPLTAEQECLARIILLVLHNRRAPLRSHIFTEELSTLFARLGITPPTESHNDTALRNILGVLCLYHQQVVRADFSQPLAPLTTHDFIVQLGRVGYKAYTMHADMYALPESGITPQSIADFATEHVANAIRCYQGTMLLRRGCQSYLRVPALEKYGIMLNTELFIQTLLKSSPKH